MKLFTRVTLFGGLDVDGFFHTGDLGYRVQGDYLCVSGRKKDLIIRGGHNIYPAKIEALASRHEAIDKVVALPAPDERLGEKVCLAVTFRAGQTVEAEAPMRRSTSADGRSDPSYPSAA